MEMEKWNMKMDLSIQDNLSRIKGTVKANIPTLKVICIQDPFKMTNVTDMVSIYMRTDKNTMENGLMVSSMAQEKSYQYQVKSHMQGNG